MSGVLHLWRFSDGRRGHDNQSLGLAEALARLTTTTRQDIAIAGRGLGAALAAVRAGSRSPALVLGAGHATHLALLIAARRHRAKSIVLMKPSLPLRLFDLCLIPEHDGLGARPGVLLTRGALNRIRPAPRRDPACGLLLIGGPSRHHGWSQDALLEQVATIVAQRRALRWVAAGSRRTPASSLQAIAALPGLRVVAMDQASPDWLAHELGRASEVWVTEDSVSMAYEAATAGARVGLLPVPSRRRGRVQRAVHGLLECGLATAFDAWRAGAELRAPTQPLAESDRCARAILDRWPVNG